MSRDAHLSIRISKDKKEALEALASGQDVTTGHLVRRAVEGLLASRVSEGSQVYGLSRTSSPDRTEELDWLEAHRDELDAFQGQWIVLEGCHLVAHGQNYDSVIQEARDRGVELPFVEWVPPASGEGAWMGL